MEKLYKLTDRVSKDSLKAPTFKKWLKRVLCFVCILSLALQLAMCVAPLFASALEYDYSESRSIFQNYLPFSFAANSVVDFVSSSLQVYYEYNTINHSVSGYTLNRLYHVDLVDDSFPALSIRFSDTDTCFVVARDDVREQWYYTEFEIGSTASDWSVSTNASSLVTNITISANVFNYSGGVAFKEFLDVVNNFLGVTSYRPFVFNNPFAVTLKAGTYRFNDVISFDTTETLIVTLPLTITISGSTEELTGMGVNYGGADNIVLFPNAVQLYTQGTWFSVDDVAVQEHTINKDTEVDDTFGTWYIANTNYNEVNVPSQVYDFTGEYRLFNEQLTNLSFAQAGTVTQSYAFDFNIWGGYNADYFTVQASGSQVDISYSFTDEASGGIKTVYRQLLRDGQIVGTWLVPRARLIYFQSNPDDPTFQQWLLDNTILIDEAMIDSIYGFGYDNGYNDGWTNSAIGDTLKAPVEALNSIVLLDIAGTTITLGGVIFTMVVLSIMLIFLKKYAGG